MPRFKILFSLQGICLLLLLIPAPSFAVGYYSAVLADNPVSYWRLGESSGTTIVDVKGVNTGVVYNSPQLGKPGALASDSNTSILFNDNNGTFASSNQHIEIADSSSLESIAFSLEAWIKPMSFDSSWDTVLMKATDNSWTNGYGLAHYNDGNNIHFYVDNYSSYNVVAPVTLGVWSYLVGTYDGQTMKIYVNGQLISSASYVTSSNHNTTAPFRIGNGGGNAYAWHGAIDEVAYYNTALSASQIANHYTATDIVPEPSYLGLLALLLVFRMRRR